MERIGEERVGIYTYSQVWIYMVCVAFAVLACLLACAVLRCPVLYCAIWTVRCGEQGV